MIECDNVTVVRKGGLFKYVRMVDGTVRFISFDRSWIPNHSDMVSRDESPFSAGTVRIDPKVKEVRMEHPDSMTLGIKSAPDDLVAIKAFVWKPRKKAALPTNPERDRIFKLAKSRVSIQAIADRIGSNYDRVRRMVERGEQRGDLPNGTLAGCALIKRPK